MIRVLIFTFLCLSSLFQSTLLHAATEVIRQPSERKLMLALVIDDLGDNLAHGEAAIALPGAITYAFLPRTPHSVKLARQAHNAGKEVILHNPMQNKKGLRLGPGALINSQSEARFRAVLEDNLDSVPHVVGLNNHMGSLLTEDRGRMDQVMSVLQRRNLFFLDSRTSARTVAWKAAAEKGMPFLIRDVFLDNEQRWDYIHHQFKQGLAVMRKQGYAIVIGHPYPETVRYLKKALPLLAQLDIELVTASQLIERIEYPEIQIPPALSDPCDRYEGHCDAPKLVLK